MHLERGSNCTSTVCTKWTTVADRWVSRAALGSAMDEGWNLLLFELKADVGGTYRLRTSNHGAGVRFFHEWRYERNPDASELKVGTYNGYYGLGDHLNKWKNASNLLATRGEIFANSMEIREETDQAPFQLQRAAVADVPPHTQPDAGRKASVAIFKSMHSARAG